MFPSSQGIVGLFSHLFSHLFICLTAFGHIVVNNLDSICAAHLRKHQLRLSPLRRKGTLQARLSIDSWSKLREEHGTKNSRRASIPLSGPFQMGIGTVAQFCVSCHVCTHLMHRSPLTHTWRACCAANWRKSGAPLGLFQSQVQKGRWPRRVGFLYTKGQ